MVLIGFDIVRVNQYYGEEVVEEQLLFAERQLLDTIGEKRSQPESAEAALLWPGKLLALRLCLS